MRKHQRVQVKIRSHVIFVVYVLYVVHVEYGTEGIIMADRQNITVQLDKETIHKAKILAAKRGTSVSGLLAAELERLVGDDASYEAARRSALAFLEKGFELGGEIRATREELHERR